ncbi:MAG TPA: hypothetical protein VGE63_00845 [Candidatus Paceibacterota bacterium]
MKHRILKLRVVVPGNINLNTLIPNTMMKLEKKQKKKGVYAYGSSLLSKPAVPKGLFPGKTYKVIIISRESVAVNEDSSKLYYQGQEYLWFGAHGFCILASFLSKKMKSKIGEQERLISFGEKMPYETFDETKVDNRLAAMYVTTSRNIFQFVIPECGSNQRRDMLVAFRPI